MELQLGSGAHYMVGDRVFPADVFHSIKQYTDHLQHDYLYIRLAVLGKDGPEAMRVLQKKGDAIVGNLLGRAYDEGVFLPLRQALPSPHWDEADKIRVEKAEEAAKKDEAEDEGEGAGSVPSAPAGDSTRRSPTFKSGS